MRRKIPLLLPARHSKSSTTHRRQAPVVSIALIRGRATGVGSELALASDMRFASREKATLSQWEVVLVWYLAADPWRDCRGSWEAAWPQGGNPRAWRHYAHRAQYAPVRSIRLDRPTSN